MIIGSVLSNFSEIELSTADDRRFSLKNNPLTRLAFKLVGLPHLGFRRRAGLILKEIERVPGTGLKILDAGCGYGLYSMTLANKGKGTIDAVDLDGERVKALGKLIAENPQIAAHIKPVTGSLTSLPFPDASYDVIICSEVIEHIPDHEKAVAELGRVLKPGGTLMLSVPHDSSFNRRTYKRFAHERPGYTRDMLSRMFAPHGVRIEKAYYYEHDPAGTQLFNIFNSIGKPALMAALFYPIYSLYWLDSKLGIGEPCYIVVRATKSLPSQN